MTTDELIECLKNAGFKVSESVEQLPLCVGIICATAVIITMIICKVDPANVVVGAALVVMFAQLLEG